MNGISRGMALPVRFGRALYSLVTSTVDLKIIITIFSSQFWNIWHQAFHREKILINTSTVLALTLFLEQKVSVEEAAVARGRGEEQGPLVPKS